MKLIPMFKKSPKNKTIQMNEENKFHYLIREGEWVGISYRCSMCKDCIFWNNNKQHLINCLMAITRTYLNPASPCTFSQLEFNSECANPHKKQQRQRVHKSHCTIWNSMFCSLLLDNDQWLKGIWAHRVKGFCCTVNCLLDIYIVFKSILF